MCTGWPHSAPECFAIAVTLLVFQLKVPSVAATHSTGPLAAAPPAGLPLAAAVNAILATPTGMSADSDRPHPRLPPPTRPHRPDPGQGETTMHVDPQVIDLATRIQRRRDFAAHVTGFLSGAIVLASLLLAGVSGIGLYIATLLTWATALSFQHFRHVLRGPVTAEAVRAEASRLGRDPEPNDQGRTQLSGRT